MTQDSFGEAGLRKSLQIALDKGALTGGWRNEKNGMFYFDCSIIIENLEEAKRFGREQNQLAIFDLNKKEGIDL